MGAVGGGGREGWDVRGPEGGRGGLRLLEEMGRFRGIFGGGEAGSGEGSANFPHGLCSDMVEANVVDGNLESM